MPTVRHLLIQQIEYEKFQVEGKPPMLKVSYVCREPLHVSFEFVCLEDGGSARVIAERWWSRRTSIPAPATVDQALRHVRALRAPEAIDVDISGERPRVIEFYGDLKGKAL